MAPPRNWTDERVRQLRTLAEAGYSRAQIAHILGATPDAIRGAAHAYGIPLQGRRHGLPSLPPGVPPMPEPQGPLRGPRYWRERGAA